MNNGFWIIIVRVVIAMIVGAAIGFEREIKDKPAGMRTHMLVAGASALLLLVNEVVVQEFITSNTGNTSSDPTRIIQAIVVGVSFIGAGTILKSDSKQNILYLTTAASILFTAALGIVIGVGRYAEAIVLACIVIVTLYLVGLFENKILEHKKIE